jgi:hypothetical protein
LCQRTIREVQDEKVERIIDEEAERRLLAAYIHGLRGVVEEQVEFQMLSTMEEAVRLAVTVENAEKHKQMVVGSRKVFASKKEFECYRCNQSGLYARDCQQEYLLVFTRGFTPFWPAMLSLPTIRAPVTRLS